MNIIDSFFSVGSFLSGFLIFIVAYSIFNIHRKLNRIEGIITELKAYNELYVGSLKLKTVGRYSTVEN